MASGNAPSINTFTSNFKNYDVGQNTSMAAYVSSSIADIRADGSTTRTDREINNMIDQRIVPGSGIIDNMEIEKYFNSRVKEYMEDTSNIVMMNDMINMNDFVTETINNQYDGTQTQYQKTVNDLNRVRKSYMLVKYNTYRTRYLIDMILFTMMMYCLAMAFVTMVMRGMLPMKLAAIIITILFSIWVIVVIMKIYQNKSRARDDWQRYIFTMATETKS